MNKIIFYIVLGVLVTLGAFHLAFTDSYCMATATFETALWNSYNIASEYYVARTGKNIAKSNEISTDITGVSGISDGFMSESYGEAISRSVGNTHIDVNNLLNLAQEVDVSQYSASELNSLALLMANNNWDGNGMAFRNIAFGGINLYFAVNKAGQWIGDSYDNILVKFDSLTNTQSSNISTVLNNNFPQSTSYAGYTDTLSCNIFNTGYGVVSGYIYFPYQCYYYTVSEPNGSYGSYKCYIMYPTNNFDRTLVGGNFINYKTVSGEWTAIPSSVTGCSLSGTHTITINGVSYTYGSLKLTIDSDSTSHTALTNTYIASYQDAVDFFTNLTGTFPGYETELIDTQGVPYVVDDLDGFASSISDLYPVIESLREVITTFPTIDEIASTISDTIADTITDAIDLIKAKAITIEETTTPDPGPSDPEVPDWFWPTFFPDLIPDDMFSMFQPVFDIVGENYSMYSIWIVIPSIIIFILILYIIISVF